MNKTITIYELLGLVKDGQQPKHIKYRGEDWWWGYDTYTYFACLEQTPDAQTNMFTRYVINYCLEDEVEIIEDNEKLETLEFQYSVIPNYSNRQEIISTCNSNFEKHQKAIRKIIDHINKIEEQLDEK